MQSAYRKHHSTETALVRVQNDILRALDEHNAVFLVLLDLSAAFDTVNHPVLLSRLKNRLGLSGTVLQWFGSVVVISPGANNGSGSGPQSPRVGGSTVEFRRGRCLAL